MLNTETAWEDRSHRCSPNAFPTVGMSGHLMYPYFLF